MSSVNVRGLTRRFGEVTAVEGFDLDIGAGQFVSIIGPSGCGKSTVLRIVAGLETSTSGTVSIDGRTPAQARAAKRVGIVPQQPGLLPWRTVLDNARLLLDLNSGVQLDHTADPVALLDEVGLGDRLDALPHELSGGMQQRVALVRALAIGAPLLLMDEPFAALDEITRASMRVLLGRLVDGRGATVLLVTHSIPEAVALSDRVIVVSPRPGRIVADIAVGLPRPRAADIEDNPAFIERCAEVRHHLQRTSAETPA